MELWIPLISEYGFPVMITFYLLHRIEKKLDLLNDSLKNVSSQLKETTLSNEKLQRIKDQRLTMI